MHAYHLFKTRYMKETTSLNSIEGSEPINSLKARSWILISTAPYKQLTIQQGKSENSANLAKCNRLEVNYIIIIPSDLWIAMEKISINNIKLKNYIPRRSTDVDLYDISLTQNVFVHFVGIVIWIHSLATDEILRFCSVSVSVSVSEEFKFECPELFA